jgi:hypothetical protein
MSTYDVVVAYRIYPGVSKVPPIFKDSKYNLAKLCLKSFKKSIGKLKVKIFVLLDNCPSEYEYLFREYFSTEDLELIRLDEIGNTGTFELQIKLLLEQNYSQFIYFAEDDYFYLTDQFEAMVNFLKRNPSDVDFISPYDHLDSYTSALHKHQSKVKIFGGKHWRTDSSTCLTFLTTKSNLQKTRKIFETYIQGNLDASIWLSLTKHKIYNISDIFRFYRTDKFLYRVVKASYLYSWRQIFFGKKWKLWSPVPSIATHMDSNFLSPNIDWLRLMEEEIREENLVD